MPADKDAPAKISFPRIRPAGVDGFLISFGDLLSEPANRAALAFRDAVERETMAGVEETSTSLVSVYLRINPVSVGHQAIARGLSRLLESVDWYAAELPANRKLWRIPTVFGTELAPQLDEAAAMAGMSPQEALAMLSTTRVRVQTIGFAPGMPYLGLLPEVWDIPRQSGLTPKVPVGALTVAIRQFVLFGVESPTGWRHVGQTAFRSFQPEAETPFPLRPGDEVVFEAVSREAFEAMKTDPMGGAVSGAIA